MVVLALDAVAGKSGALGAKHGLVPAAYLDTRPAHQLWRGSSTMGGGGGIALKRQDPPAIGIVAFGARDVERWFCRHVRYDPSPRPDRWAGAFDLAANARDRNRSESVRLMIGDMRIL